MQLFANNADSSLNGAIAPDTTVLALKAGDGAKFPSPTNGDFFLVTLFQRLGTSELNHEIVKCTSRTGDSLTVVRAQEGTVARAFNSDDLVELRITKGTVENFSQPENLATKEPVIAPSELSPTEKYWRGDKTWRDFFTDVRAATLTGLSTATNTLVEATDTVLSAISKLQAQVSLKFDKAGGDVTGNAYFKAGVQEQTVVSNTGAAYTINLGSGTIFDLTLTANCVYTFPAATAGKQFTLLQKQDAAGSRASTWPSNVRWAKGTAPTPTTTAGRTDAFAFLGDGTYWIGFVGGQDFNRA